MRWWQRLKRSVRFNYLRVIRMKASAHSIALGMAVGVFVGFLPIIPFQTIGAVALAFLVRANKITAALGTWVSNPVNMIPFYSMLFFVGQLVLPFSEVSFVINAEQLELEKMLEHGWQVVLVMIVGGVILGIPSALIAYVITLRAVLAYRRRRALSQLRKKMGL